MQKKKNGVLLFIFSFCPGAGELYMGFMKMGLSLLTIFFLSIFMVSILNIPELGTAVAIIYIYSFFHAHNIAGLDDDKFYALTDEYVWGSDGLNKVTENAKGKNKATVAIILIVLGVIMLWNSGIELLHDYLGGDMMIVKLLYEISDYVPRVIIAISIVIYGLFLFTRKKSEDKKES